MRRCTQNDGAALSVSRSSSPQATSPMAVTPMGDVDEVHAPANIMCKQVSYAVVQQRAAER